MGLLHASNQWGSPSCTKQGLTNVNVNTLASTFEGVTCPTGCGYLQQMETLA